MPSRLPKPLAKFVAAVQAFVPVTQGELIAVMVILSGLGIGIVLRIWREPLRDMQIRSEILHLADSLAIAEESTYTGITPDAEPIQAFTAADTVVKPKLARPLAAKKEKITSGVIRLNTASVQDLMRLPGVGEATAQKIYDARKERPFSRIEDVMRVKGIGKKKFEAMKPFLGL